MHHLLSLGVQKRTKKNAGSIRVGDSFDAERIAVSERLALTLSAGAFCAQWRSLSSEGYAVSPRHEKFLS
jgi:hypothetical protein